MADREQKWDALMERHFGDDMPRHPRGLRDAIAGASASRSWPDSAEARNVEIAVRAWLSVVSEGEIEVAAPLIFELCCAAAENPATWDTQDEAWKNEYRDEASKILAASREVLIPKAEK